METIPILKVDRQFGAPLGSPCEAPT